MSKKERPESDRPPEDLRKERDAFIESFFRKGAQLTEELLRENERLTERMSELESENGRLRAHVASDDAIRELVRKIELLEKDKAELLSRSAMMQKTTDQYSYRASEVESELSNLASLYVALSQLHAARSVRSVLRSLKELLSQFVGAGSFAVYLLDDDGASLVAVATEGARRADVARLPLSGAVGSAVTSSQVRLSSTRDCSTGSPAEPAAVVPLTFDGRTVGAIAVFATLPQKTAFLDVDTELFRLLGVQAVAALVHAHLLVGAGREMPSVQAFAGAED